MRLVALAIVCVVLGIATSAVAREGARGAEIVAVAERAQAVGEYGFAIQGFAVAYGLTKRPALVFSIARAYRQRFALERAAADASHALRFARRYLQLAPRGAHAAEARKIIAELEPLRPGSPKRELYRTRLGVTSNALAARLAVDGGRPLELPAFVEVAPGKHRVEIRAPGFAPSVRVVRFARGSLYARHVVLAPLPGKLVVEGPSDAVVRVDGKPAGTLPFDEPLELEPGSRFVAVTRTGYRPYAREIEVRRGKLTTLAIDLEMTAQRKAAWPLVATGAAGVAAGIVLGVFAVVRHREAIDIQDRGGLPAEYDPVLAERDAFRLGSGIAAGIGFGVFLVGGALLVFDEPAVPTRRTGILYGF